MSQTNDKHQLEMHTSLQPGVFAGWEVGQQSAAMFTNLQSRVNAQLDNSLSSKADHGNYSWTSTMRTLTYGKIGPVELCYISVSTVCTLWVSFEPRHIGGDVRG